MSDAPDTIYLRWYGDARYKTLLKGWNSQRWFDDDIEYVRRDKADALAEAIEFALDESEEPDGVFTWQGKSRTALDAYRGEA